MDFEWDPRKADINLQKHQVAFAEAATVFGDDFAITVQDPDHSKTEERYITIGWSHHRRLLIVSHTDRNNRIRIISARELTKAEKQAYEEEN
jgi:uncharacterized protein